jgi:hypothetical protein
MMGPGFFAAALWETVVYYLKWAFWTALVVLALVFVGGYMVGRLAS